MKKYNRRVYDLVDSGSKYIYEEKYKKWVSFVVNSVFLDDHVADMVVSCMEMLSNGVCASEVLDYIYSTRYPLKTIFSIQLGILHYYRDGPRFIREIFAAYLTSDIEELLEKVECENNVYIKQL